MISDALLQTGGASLLVVGIASPKKVIARDFMGSLHWSPGPVGRTGYGGSVWAAF